SAAPAPLIQLGNGSYNITAVGTNPGVVGNVTDLHLMLANGVVGTHVVATGSTAAPEVKRTLTIALPATDLYNRFYIGSVDAVSSPLPITLLSFTASPVNGSVKLDWETTSEINNDHFTIQRSRNSVDWESIKVVPGAVNSSVNVKYSEYDGAPYQGISYYRLQQTDRDGKTSFSPIVSVKIGQSASINIYPNPTSDHIWITTVGSGRLNVALYNNNGRRINVPVTVNGNSARLDVGKLSAGTYFVHILQGGQSESRVVLITR
ncbi:MAG: T9SS type A sorting domain-containing protein, partial [Ginsengibacter sp.]